MDRNVFVCTWNAGNAAPCKLDPLFTGLASKPDVVVCGMQESTWGAMNEVKVVQDAWQSALGDEYDFVDHVQRAQLQLFLFAKKVVKNEITHIEKSAENTGLLGIYPNKGGILLAFNLNDTPVAFLSCHLTAHEGKSHCQQRNDSIVEIFEGARVRDTRYDITSQFHHIFWMGDMNYRTTYSKDEPKPHRAAVSSDELKTKKEILAETNAKDEEDGDEEEEIPSDRLEEMKAIYKMIDDSQWAAIAGYDELNRELAAGRVLTGFTALHPSFPPTFKRKRAACIKKNENDGYIVEFKNPETLVLKKKKDKSKTEGVSALENDVTTFYDIKRLPSYTDRILYKSLPAFAGNLQSIGLKSCEEIDSSDHKPVFTSFNITTTRGVKEIARSENPFKISVSKLVGTDLENLDIGGKSDPYCILSCKPCELFYPVSGASAACCSPLSGLFSRLMVSADQRQLMNHEVRTSVIDNDLNPAWPDVLVGDIGSTDIDNLMKHAHLTFGLWDDDNTNDDDVIGTVIISFKEIFDGIKATEDASSQTESYYDFDKTVLNGGVYRGKLKGRISLNETIASIRARHAAVVPAAAADNKI